MRCKHMVCHQCADDCGQDGPVCATPPGCSRHWADRCRELVDERDEAVEALESLEAAILESLPYRYDDGTDDEADPGECIEYAAEERLRMTMERDEARAERDDLRQWQYEVAEGVGYLATAEGQGGYEVASAAIIVQAFKQMEREAFKQMERDEARAELAKIIARTRKERA